jgi:hypothetical protein
MRQIRLIAVLSAILAAAIVPFVRVAHAVPDMPPLDPADLALKDNPAEPGAAAMYLYREVFINEKVEGRVYEEDLDRIKIFTEAGKKYGDVEIEYVKGYSDVRDVHGRTIHPDGTIIEFKGQVLDKTIFRTGDFRDQVKSFSLPDVTPGSVIEYGFKYSINGLPPGADWHVQDRLFTRHAHFGFQPYGGATTASLRWRAYRLANAEPRKQSDGSWTLDLENIKGLPEEEFMQPRDELTSWLQFFYTRTVYTPDPKVYWDRIAKEWAESNEKFIGNHDSVRGVAAQAVSTGDPPETKLHKLYVRAQQIHNASYDPIKTTQEEKREKPVEIKNADEVLKRGVAYKLDINRFYVALVRAVGFEADLAWARSRTKSFFHEDLEETSQLDESLVYVRAGNKEYYLDPGNMFSPFGMLPWYETAITVFRPTKQGAVFAQTPESPSSASSTERRARLTLDPDGSLSGTLLVRFTGDQAFVRRIRLRDDDEVGRKKSLSDEIKGWLPNDAKFEVTDIANWEKIEDPVEVQGKITLPSMGQVAGKRILLPVGLYLSSLGQIFDATTRKQDIYFVFQYETIDDFKIQLPTGCQPEGFPPPRNSSPGGGLHFEISAKQEGGGIHVQRKLVIGGMLFPADLYPEIRNFFHSAKTSDDQQFILHLSQ